jgi:hypothetical protein
MSRRDQWNFSSVGRGKISVGRDASSHGSRENFYTMRCLVVWFTRKILYHAMRRRMVQRNTQTTSFMKIARNVSFFR